MLSSSPLPGAADLSYVTSDSDGDAIATPLPLPHDVNVDYSNVLSRK